MSPTIRPATTDDVDAIARLSAVQRRRLAGWSPTWWRPAAGADDVHPLWLRHVVETDGPVVRVADDGGEIVGCAASMPQGDRWVVDDLAVSADHRWADAGAALLSTVGERPALTCAPSADGARIEACRRVGLGHVSTYWIRDAVPGDAAAAARPLAPGTPVPEPPPHTFGGALDPATEGALALAGDGDGLVVGSPSFPAPPVYDPGGTVCIVDRMVGAGDDLVDATLAAAARRGDVLVAVVAAAADDRLQTLLAGRGFRRTVDVYGWA